MGYRHAGAWVLGLEGAALLRALAGDFDRAFVEARLREVVRIVADLDGAELSESAVVGAMSTVEGYASWSASYDAGDNPLLQVEEPVVRSVLSRLGSGDALDAACGTGRWTRQLIELGHNVVGVDSSPHMLQVAAHAAPQATLLLGDVNDLPVADRSMDLVVCALALTHQPDLRTPLAEFARVLRPGGTLVISDIHIMSLYLGGVAGAINEQGQPCLMPATRFLASDYLRAAFTTGLVPVDCQEPPWGGPGGGGTDARKYCPEAADACYTDTPAAIIWRFQKPAGSAA